MNLDPADLTPRIYLGDWLRFAQLIDDGGVDHWIGDPPYLKHTHQAQRRGGGREGVHSSRRVDFAHITPEQRRAYAFEIGRITRRWAVVFTDVDGYDGWKVDLEAGGMEVVRQLLWIRGALDLDDIRRKVIRGKKGAPQFTGDRPSQGHECMVLAHAAARRGRAKPPAMRWNGRRSRTDGTGGLTGSDNIYYADIETAGRQHDTQKPLELMRELVRDYTDPGDLICDGFVGLATTLVAAKLEGRRSIGSEVAAKHHRNAVARAQAVAC